MIPLVVSLALYILIGVETRYEPLQVEPSAETDLAEVIECVFIYDIRKLVASIRHFFCN